MNEVRWSAPEFEYHEKTHAWFGMILLGMIAVILVALWQNNLLFAFFAIIAGVLVLRWGKEQPDDVDFEINQAGLAVGDKHPHPWEEFVGFAIHRLHHEEEGLSELVLKRKGGFGTFWKVLVPNMEVERVRVFTNHHLPEIEFEDSFVEHISRLLRF